MSYLKSLWSFFSKNATLKSSQMFTNRNNKKFIRNLFRIAKNVTICERVVFLLIYLLDHNLRDRWKNKFHSWKWKIESFSSPARTYRPNFRCRWKSLHFSWWEKGSLLTNVEDIFKNGKYYRTIYCCLEFQITIIHKYHCWRQIVFTYSFFDI